VAGLSSPVGPGPSGPSSGTERDRDRGQIILVTAFALAVAFVALSVVINGAIFTQNLATRGDTAGGGDALQQRHQAEQVLGDLVEHVNANYSGSGETDTRTHEFRNATSDLSNASSYQQSVSGRAVDYTYAGASNGTRIVNGSDTFENASGSEDWVVAENVPDTRQFDMQVNTSVLPSLTGAFAVNVTNGSHSWQMEVYQGTVSEDINVTVTTGTGETRSCAATGSEVDINVTAGLLDGQPCSALEFGKNVSGDYDIVYNNSDSIKGSYSLVVNTTSGIGDVPNGNDEEVLYSATVDYTYRTANLVYETDIRVAPGEPDD